MINLFKGKKEVAESKLYAPVDGKMISLDEVKDPVFSQKMMGDGVAFCFESSKVCAPCDGELTMVFPTKHAFGIKMDNGAEILVHIGLDTVNLKGEGFKQLVKENTKVSRGTAVIEVDREFMKNNNIDLTTPVIVTNSGDFDIKHLSEFVEVEVGSEVIELVKK